MVKHVLLERIRKSVLTLAWRARQLHPNLPYRVAGGNTALVIALIMGVIIMVIPFLMQAGILPSVAG